MSCDPDNDSLIAIRKKTSILLVVNLYSKNCIARTLSSNSLLESSQRPAAEVQQRAN